MIQSVLGMQNIWETTENWENEAISSGLVTRRLYFKKKKDIKRPFFPPCRNWPICFTYMYIYVESFNFRMLLTSHGSWGQRWTTSPLKAQWHQDRWKMSSNFFPFSKIIWLLAWSELFLCTGLQQCLRQQGVLKTGATRILLRDHFHLYHDHPGCYI